MLTPRRPFSHERIIVTVRARRTNGAVHNHRMNSLSHEQVTRNVKCLRYSVLMMTACPLAAAPLADRRRSPECKRSCGCPELNTRPLPPGCAMCEPGYVTANVVPLTLRSATAHESGVYVLVSPVSCYRVLKHVQHVAAGSPLSAWSNIASHASSQQAIVSACKCPDPSPSPFPAFVSAAPCVTPIFRQFRRHHSNPLVERSRLPPLNSSFCKT